jgi:1-acyl-sn-glycerol-3-phosphate acyltransferase
VKDRFYRFARALARAYFAIFLPLRARGTENIPESGAVILCGNHISMLDPVTIGVIAKRSICFMAKKELFAIKPFAAVLKRLNAFSVDRKNTDMAAMRTAMAILRRGDVLGIFPEGSREKPGVEPKLETGVGLIAMRSNAAVVPVRIVGPYRLFRRTGVAFGAPIDMDDLRGRADGEALGEAVRRIGDAIFALKT